MKCLTKSRENDLLYCTVIKSSSSIKKNAAYNTIMMCIVGSASLTTIVHSCWLFSFKTEVLMRWALNHSSLWWYCQIIYQKLSPGWYCVIIRVGYTGIFTFWQGILVPIENLYASSSEPSRISFDWTWKFVKLWSWQVHWSRRECWH